MLAVIAPIVMAAIKSRQVIWAMVCLPNKRDAITRITKAPIGRKRVLYNPTSHTP